jgi:dolichol-phosphate mannosyltransferase
VTAEGLGYGAILGAGLQRARGDYVVTMDAVFSHRAGYVRTMWHHRHRAEVLLGSRYVRGAYAEMKGTRRFASRLLNFLYRKMLALPYRDLSSGFRLYRRAVLDDVFELGDQGRRRGHKKISCRQITLRPRVHVRQAF